MGHAACFTAKGLVFLEHEMGPGDDSAAISSIGIELSTALGASRISPSYHRHRLASLSEHPTMFEEKG